MEKRLILAIALSMLVMLTWSVLVPKPQVQKLQTTVTQELAENKASVPLEVPTTSSTSATVTPDELISFDQGKMEILFNPVQAAIYEIIFKEQLEHRWKLTNGISSGEGLKFKLQAQTSDAITFVAEDQTRRVIKKFTFNKDKYLVNLEIQTKNLTNKPLLVNSSLILGRLDLSARNPQSRFQGIFLSTKEKNLHLPAHKDYSSQELKFAGLKDQFFCAIVEPVNLSSQGYIRKINPQESEVSLTLPEQNIKPGEQIGHLFKIYLGPQDLKILNSFNPEWTSIIHFGTFDFITQILLQLLGFFYSLVKNWGVAIVMLSVAVYFLLFPLTLKQMRSMKEMQTLQPKIEALRLEYKNNPQRLNKEMMSLYKEHKVNPLSGCLPVLLQMPIFFALYQALIRSTALRGARFLWINDLSAPDHLFIFQQPISLLWLRVDAINILPILMAVGMFIQQRMSLTKATGEAAQQQKMMSIIMPIMFGVIFYQMPAGFSLYWVVNSVFTLAYQLRINQQK